MLNRINDKDGEISYVNEQGEELFKFIQEDVEYLSLNNVKDLNNHEKKKILEKIEIMLEEIDYKEQFVFDNILCYVVSLDTLNQVKNSLLNEEKQIEEEVKDFKKELLLKKIKSKLLTLENSIKQYSENRESIIENMGKLFFSKTGRLCLIMIYFEVLLKQIELNKK